MEKERKVNEISTISWKTKLAEVGRPVITPKISEEATKELTGGIAEGRNENKC